MEIFLITIGALFILAGIIGSFLPVIPGPPLGYVGLLFLQFTESYGFSISFLAVWGLIVVVVVTLENILPAVGTSRYGGTRYGILGSMIGIVAGLFFPPFGIIIGPLIGAFLGELLAGQKSDAAMRSAIGSFVGFVVGTLLKVIVSLMLAYYFVTNIW